MKVVMLQDVKGIGQKGTVQEVSDGFAFNALIPQGKAEQATKEKEAEAKKRLAAAAESAEEAHAAHERQAAELEGKRVSVEAKANAQGHLYKQLEASAISSAIKAEHGIEVPAGAVHAKIRETGDHQIEIRLGSHKAHLTVEVVAES
jgi:large subunit ribosomal protein L9